VPALKRAAEKRNLKMNLRRVTTVSASAALMILISSTASAGCGDVSSLQAPFVFPQTTLLSSPSLASVEAKAASNSNSSPSIEGMWSFQFIAKGDAAGTPSIPDGAQVDFGYIQYHSDGTELLNSGSRAPATENFCMGVWEKTGYSSYQVNHFALSYDAVTGTLNGKAHIQETVTLSPGGTQLSGTFTIDNYNAAGTTIVAHVAGTLTAVRITVDTPTP
jgi:hypothetical protein